MHNEVIFAAASLELTRAFVHSVPHAAVAFIIGFAGSVIEDMEIKSGARINIAKPPTRYVLILVWIAVDR